VFGGAFGADDSWFFDRHRYFATLFFSSFAISGMPPMR